MYMYIVHCTCKLLGDVYRGYSRQVTTCNLHEHVCVRQTHLMYMYMQVIGGIYTEITQGQLWAWAYNTELPKIYMYDCRIIHVLTQLQLHHLYGVFFINTIYTYGCDSVVQKVWGSLGKSIVALVIKPCSRLLNFALDVYLYSIVHITIFRLDWCFTENCST